ncbi:MAG: hypothetical protein LBL79_09595 [Prevotella sp.]|jgi:hypothetical protein|nr:hypothetical protein [Prevotella sp.]
MNEEKYKNIIDQIKGKQPVISDPQKLTAGIMSSIQPDQGKKPCVRFLEILSWASSVAVIFLLGLFITEKPVSAKSPVQVDWKAPDYTSALQFEANSDTRDNIESIIRFKSERQRKRQFFYSKLAGRY